KPGEMLGIIGPNGAGKSTLLKILSRITAPTAGSLRYQGRLTSLLEVGTGFHRELTGRENIFLNGSILGMSRAEIARKLDAIVAFAEIEKFLDTPVKFYSSGMYVRLAFAVSAHLEPDILLIDEVLAVGDLRFQRKCMERARKLRDGNATVLFVSHNMFVIKAMCDRVVYLRGGRVIHDGDGATAIDLYEKDSRLEIATWATGIVGTDRDKCPLTVTDIQLFDEAGQPRTMFEFGERMRVRLAYEAKEPVSAPNFCIGIIRSDNTPCCFFSATLDGLKIASVHGRGVLELLTPPLKLVAETYTINTALWNADFQRLYSAQTRCNFHVRHDLLDTNFGVFHEPAEWKML
ncbi:MAG: ABC transporter ATP-binding protein, partial [Verrucomicrobia bacterium]|nr:ABC transporter ATP-binding protein [Verrucomicrobiota bacterium]